MNSGAMFGQLVHTGREFLAWWHAALLSLVPAGLQRLWSDRRTYLRLEWSEREAILIRRFRGRETVLSRGPADDTWHALGSAEARSIRSLIVNLGPEQIFRRTIVLPMAAEANLARLMPNEIDRQTPFPADQVYFDYRVAARDEQAKQIAVQLFITKRSIVDELRRGAARSGHRIEAVTNANSDGEAPPLDLLRWSAAGASRPMLFWLNSGLATAAGVLAVACVTTGLQKLDDEIDRLNGQIARARTQAQQAEALRREVVRLTETSTFVARRRAGPTPLAVLQEATDILPDNAWTYEFHLTGQTLRLAGYAHDAPGLIALFEKSALLSNAQFRAPVSRVASRGVDRFDLSVDVRAQRMGRQP